jgi:hypothetical protein
VHVPSDRRPAALLPAPLARTVAFALLALLGVAEWARMFEGGGLADGLPVGARRRARGRDGRRGRLALAADAVARRDAGRRSSG